MKLPGSVLVGPLTLGASIAQVSLSFLSWWAIHSTGRYPRRLFDFNVALFQWVARVYALEANLTDDWSLLGTTKGVGITVGVGTLFVVSVISANMAIQASTRSFAAEEATAIVEEFMMPFS